MVAAILYADHENHLTPLTLAYHATASRHVTSGRTDVIPPSMSTEVDSVYCPRCLTYCDVASALSGFCQLDLESGSSAISCKDCPVCFSPLAVSIDADDNSHEKHLICRYLCGYCKWSSSECGITSNADKLIEYKTNPDDPAKEAELEQQRQVVIAGASKELERCLRQTIEGKNQMVDEVFKSLTNMWSQKEKDEERKRRLGLGSDKSNTMMKGQTWSLEVLEQSLEEKRNKIASHYIPEAQRRSITSSTDKISAVNQANDSDATLPTSQQIAAQMIISNTAPRFRSDLLPLPVPFRARVSRRCLAEQAAGKTGILVKPKLNPLEGDSSLRAGHGQWFKKDSSAVNSVPRIQICSYGKDSTGLKYAVLMKVRNPTLSMIRLRFSPPSLKGSSENCFINERELENIPIEPFSQKFVNAHAISASCIDSLTPTDWVELENAEDMFLDMGTGHMEDPPNVRNWKASAVLDAVSDGIGSTLRIVASQKDTAWVEMLALAESSLKQASAGKSHLAIPFGMQIEVGNGSWEASLIKKQDLPKGEMDMVTLNVAALLD
ncbi:hypothetical protein ACHAWO_012526 [Cyclotella atomus]|uniref:Dynactin subunit 4 n=1 Tax=Cyclotella atomus TaxID=382360 RepID=A0ABD3NR58_9STRA